MDCWRPILAANNRVTVTDGPLTHSPRRCNRPGLDEVARNGAHLRITSARGFLGRPLHLFASRVDLVPNFLYRRSEPHFPEPHLDL